jgi:hypothetical protein
VGLGVYPENPLDNSDGDIKEYGRFVRSVDSAVVHDTAFLRAEGRCANFASGVKSGVQSSSGLADFTLVNGRNVCDTTRAEPDASRTSTFCGCSDEAMKQYAIGSVTALPVPESVSLMAGGLCAIGFVARRHPARAAWPACQ